jgi:hypothetical protein
MRNRGELRRALNKTCQQYKIINVKEELTEEELGYKQFLIKRMKKLKREFDLATSW